MASSFQITMRKLGDGKEDEELLESDGDLQEFEDAKEQGRIKKSTKHGHPPNDMRNKPLDFTRWNAWLPRRNTDPAAPAPQPQPINKRTSPTKQQIVVKL